MIRSRKWMALIASLMSTCLATTIVCDVPSVAAVYDYLRPTYVVVDDDDDDCCDDDCCYYDDCCYGGWFGWWW